MFAKTADGTKIHYAITGSGPAKVVLVHPLGLDHAVWAPVAQRLAQHAEILTLDCRGHGASDKPAGPYTVEVFADDLAFVLTHAGWSKAVVAGVSMGGCVALAFADRYPGRCAGLGLVDTTAWYGAGAAATWEDRARKALDDGLDSLIAFQLTRWFSDGFRAEHPQVVQHWAQVFAGADPAAYAESCRLLGALDLRAVLGTITAPTCIVVGKDDEATPPAMAQALHDAIPGSHLEVVPGRHLTLLESPNQVAETLHRLIRETQSA